MATTMSFLDSMHVETNILPMRTMTVRSQ